MKTDKEYIVPRNDSIVPIDIIFLFIVGIIILSYSTPDKFDKACIAKDGIVATVANEQVCIDKNVKLIK
jgi:hypothetical protein